MAVAFTATKTGTLLKRWSVTAQDADTSGNQAHGFSTTPNWYFVTPQIAAAQGLTVGATNATFVKEAGTGGGGMPGTTIISFITVGIFHSILA